MGKSKLTLLIGGAVPECGLRIFEPDPFYPLFDR